MKTKKPDPVVVPTADDLEMAALLFERWATVIRAANGDARALGSVSLTWSRKTPDSVHVQVHGAKDERGLRTGIDDVLDVHNRALDAQVAKRAPEVPRG